MYLLFLFIGLVWGKPIELVEDLVCYQHIETDWISTANYQIFESPNPLNLYGKSEYSLLFVNTQDQLIKVVLFTDLSGYGYKHKHSHRIYKRLSKKYRKPYTTKTSWRWYTDQSVEIQLGATNPGMAVVLKCP